MLDFLSLPFFLLNSSDAKEHIRDTLRCRLTGAVASARPCENAAILPKARCLLV